jgi:hypothetical protein
MNPGDAAKKIMTDRYLDEDSVVEGNLVLRDLPPGIVRICGLVLGEVRIGGINEGAIIWKASCARSINISGHLRKTIRFCSSTNIDHELRIDAIALSKVIIDKGCFISENCVFQGEFMDNFVFGGKTGNVHLNGLFERTVEFSETAEISGDICLFGRFLQGLPGKIRGKLDGRVISRSGVLR